MKPYSNGLRHRIVEAYESGEYTLNEVADIFIVSLVSVKNFLRRKCLTGSPDVLPHAGGNKPLLNDKDRFLLRDAIVRDNDLTLDELRRLLQSKHKKSVSLPTLSRLLQALDLPRSRFTPQNVILSESSKPARTIERKSGK